MAREGCNLDKDEADLLKVPPSSSSSSSPTPPPGPQSSQPTLFMKPPPQDLAIQMGSGSRKQEADPHLPPRVPPQGSSGPCCKRKAPPEAAAAVECPPPARAAANRCCSCQRKVGLMGFRCRCGDLFCSRHRYSDAHGCSYDYKAAGREEIARNNPVVRAAKIIRI